MTLKSPLVDSNKEMTRERTGDRLQITSLKDILEQRALIPETIDLWPHELYGFTNPRGIEVGDLLDPDHMPRVTRFQTVIFSNAFNCLRGLRSPIVNPYGIPGANPEWLKTISSVAAQDKVSYNVTDGVAMRRRYTDAMVASLDSLYQTRRVGSQDTIVPVLRCGENVATRMKSLDGVRRVPIEIKRLRFKNSPDLLGAGLVLSPETVLQLQGRHIRLLEGVVASGSSELAFAVGARHLGINPIRVDCDAAIVCPAGTCFAERYLEAMGIEGRNFGAFVGGSLDENWYVRYLYKDDPLLKLFGEDAGEFLGRQVLGDGGDLTSNLN